MGAGLFAADALNRNMIGGVAVARSRESLDDG